jgi:hypothetical protein
MAGLADWARSQFLSWARPLDVAQGQAPAQALAGKYNPGGAVPDLTGPLGGAGMHPLDRAATATMTTPVLGDAVGLLADARRYVQEPESRTLGNFALTGLGMLPFVPGMTVFHGSPHKFDRFDSSKIGTGEGAQAYGHGLYVAESPGTAKTYQAALSDTGGTPKTTRMPDGTEVPMDDHIAAITEEIRRSTGMHPVDAEGVAWDLATRPAPFTADDLASFEPPWRDAYKVADKANRGAIPQKNTGHLYEVDLPDEAIDKMLDWDAPLSEQPAAVREALAQRFAKDSDVPVSMAREQIDAMTDTGAQFYRNESMNRGGAPVGTPMHQSPRDDVAVSVWLREAGIPGIKYFDAAGGGRATGEGTRNFVVFDDSLLDIVKRNDQPIKGPLAK